MSHLDWVATVLGVLLAVIAGALWDANKKLDRIANLIGTLVNRQTESNSNLSAIEINTRKPPEPDSWEADLIAGHPDRP